MNLTAIDLDIMLRRVGVADALEYPSADRADAAVMEAIEARRENAWRVHGRRLSVAELCAHVDA